MTEATVGTALTVAQRAIDWSRVVEPVAERSAASVDAIVDPRAIVARLHPNIDNAALPAEARVSLVTRGQAGEVAIGILPGAHIQFAERLDIPRPYYERMLATAPQLLVENLNHWLRSSEPERRLLRMFKPITETQQVTMTELGLFANARAYLSNSYRPLDHGALVDVVLPEAQQRGAVPTDAILDDQRFRLKLQLVERNVGDIIRAKNLAPGNHAAANEIVSFGVMVTNSETGHATLKVEPYMRVLRCWNGMVVSVVDAMRVVHLGSKQKDEGWVQADTRRVDDAATFLKVRDRVRHMLSEETASTIAGKMSGAMDTLLPVEIPLMEFVELASGKMDLTKAELVMLKEEVVGEAALQRASGLRASAWTLAQGVTATARVAEPERQVELETLGWKVLDDPAAFLKLASGKK
jgi:hypothetical protein